jgi:hypothetical protein
MSMIDPKGSRQELDAMAIIRAHRAQMQQVEASPVLAAQPAPLIVLPIPGFWESLTHHIHAVSPDNQVQYQESQTAQGL